MTTEQAIQVPADKAARGQVRHHGSGRGNLRGWMFVGPVVLGTLAFNVIPVAPTLVTSFTDWDGLSAPKFTGLANYEQMFSGSDPLFGRSLINTLIYTVGYVPVGIVIGIALALLVNNRLRGMAVIRALIFLPYVTSLVAVGVVSRWVFSDQYGIINAILAAFGITGPHWLGEPASAMAAVIVTAIWANMGFNMIIILAGLQGVPESLIEAATLDGAGRLSRFVHVTLPFLTPTIFMLSILQTIGSFQVFALILVMTGGGPGDGTYVYIYHLWYQAFTLRKMGYASALAVALFAILLAVTWIQNRLSKRWVFYQ
ncbi:sugar ABC transporter permease [Actinopolymorpha sp. NPDC004070]|uniref:carbohydrate ABC transporter permease n=1 Tax=Actinopolymorpha sp. NPDC004070 TaxID=3154548 RepID=UPI0033B2B124